MNTDSFELELDDEELELELSHGSDTCCSLGIAPFVVHMQLRFEQWVSYEPSHLPLRMVMRVSSAGSGAGKLILALVYR